MADDEKFVQNFRVKEFLIFFDFQFQLCKSEVIDLSKLSTWDFNLNHRQLFF